MKLSDLFSLIITNLSRRKGRVALTAVGVIIGTAAVVVLVSLAFGLQRSATASLYGIGELTQIQVYPKYQESMSSSGEPNYAPITEQVLADFAALDGVETVVPRDYIRGGYVMQYKKMEGYSNLVGIAVDALSTLGYTADQGVTTLERGTAIIGKQVAMNFYNPNQRPGEEAPETPDLYGETLKLKLQKWDNEGNTFSRTVQVRVAGILTESSGESDWSMYVRLDEMNGWNEWLMGRRINRTKDGYDTVIVKATDVDKTTSIVEQITEMGFSAYTPQSFIEGINSYYLILQIGFGGIGAIALFVAAIGIANTMAMAILERTREIGLMKAVGATNRQIMAIFLGEAAGIGLLGGVGGVVLGWTAGQVLNVLGQVYLASQITQDTYYSSQTISVYTPAWLLLFTLVFSIVIGLLSGIYPALNAATMPPITALKYE
jgi:putative ABC transport system permease protein